MKEVELYTDGACSGNPGKGGWGAVLIYKNNRKELSGGEQETTNNRMEIKAVIQGLKQLKEGCRVNIYSDSAYVVNAFLNGWIETWQKSNWKTTSKKPVLNIDLWQELLKELERHSVMWNKVKGHSDNELNNRCDYLATNEIKKLQE